MTHTYETRAVEVRAIEGKDEYEATLATEYPYRRSWGLEVLRCDAASVNLDRAKDGLPLLAHHDRERLVGRVSNVRVQGGKLRGRVKFFDTTEGRDAMAAVKGGHRDLSVGYQIETTKPGKGDEVFVTRWTPYETSFVSIGADPDAGINRAHAHHESDTIMQTTENRDFDPAALSRSQQRAAKRGEDVERERVAEITAMGDQFAKHPGVPELVREAVANGAAVDDVRQAILAAIATKPLSTYVGARQYGGRNDFSLARAIQSQIDPAAYLRAAGHEIDQSRELASRAAIKPNGVYVPFSAIFGPMHRQLQERAMSVGAPTLGGSTVQSTIDTSMFADVLRAASVCAPLGARMMTGLTDTLLIPRKTASVSTDWVTEVGATTAYDPTTDNLTLSPKRIGAHTIYSRQLLIQSALDLEQMIQQDLATTILKELDRVAMLGTGASNQPRGIANTAGIGAVVGGTNGLALNWGHVLDLERTVAAANGLVQPATAGYAINPATRGWAKRQLKVTGFSTELMMGDDPIGTDGLSNLNGYKAAVSTFLPANGTKGTSSGVCSTLIFGDWSELIIGQFGPGIELIVDPYSLATTGQVRIIANLFADVVVRRPQSFAAMTDALTV